MGLLLQWKNRNVKSKTFRARPLADVFADIEAAARLSPNAPRIFLADGDALVLPADGLAAILDKLAATFPALERVSCYATPINLMHKPVVELCSPRAKKLLLVYQMVRGRIYLTKPQFERLLAHSSHHRPASRAASTATDAITPRTKPPNRIASFILMAPLTSAP